MYFDGLGGEKNPKKALELYKTALSEDKLQAELNFGLAYLKGIDNGHTILDNYIEAKKWFEQAASDGEPLSRYYLGMIYYDGMGIKQDKQMAAEWLTLAAEIGNEKAQLLLGEMYESGDGVEKNEAVGLDWIRRSAAQGFKPAVEKLQKLQQ